MRWNVIIDIIVGILIQSKYNTNWKLYLVVMWSQKSPLIAHVCTEVHGSPFNSCDGSSLQCTNVDLNMEPVESPVGLIFLTNAFTVKLVLHKHTFLGDRVELAVYILTDKLVESDLLSKRVLLGVGNKVTERP